MNKKYSCGDRGGDDVKKSVAAAAGVERVHRENTIVLHAVRHACEGRKAISTQLWDEDTYRVSGSNTILAVKKWRATTIFINCLLLNPAF